MEPKDAYNCVNIGRTLGQDCGLRQHKISENQRPALRCMHTKAKTIQYCSPSFDLNVSLEVYKVRKSFQACAHSSLPLLKTKISEC